MTSIENENEDQDSLRVNEKEDGSFEIEWDGSDPRYSFLNGLTEEEITELLTRGLEEKIKVWESENESESN